MPHKLKDLIRSGKLRTGTRLHHPARIHRERAVEALVVHEGIKLGGTVFTTPSAAAEFITRGAVNGWVFWKLPDGSHLGSLRSGT